MSSFSVMVGVGGGRGGGGVERAPSWRAVGCQAGHGGTMPSLRPGAALLRYGRFCAASPTQILPFVARCVLCVTTVT